jgi:hypothetical protein
MNNNKNKESSIISYYKTHSKERSYKYILQFLIINVVIIFSLHFIIQYIDSNNVFFIVSNPYIIPVITLFSAVIIGMVHTLLILISEGKMETFMETFIPNPKLASLITNAVSVTLGVNYAKYFVNLCEILFKIEIDIRSHHEYIGIILGTIFIIFLYTRIFGDESLKYDKDEKLNE